MVSVKLPVSKESLDLLDTDEILGILSLVVNKLDECFSNVFLNMKKKQKAFKSVCKRLKRIAHCKNNPYMRDLSCTVKTSENEKHKFSFMSGIPTVITVSVFTAIVLLIIEILTTLIATRMKLYAAKIALTEMEQSQMEMKYLLNEYLDHFKRIEIPVISYQMSDENIRSLPQVNSFNS